MEPKLFSAGMTLFLIGGLICILGWSLTLVAASQRNYILWLQTKVMAADSPKQRNEVIREYNAAVEYYGWGTRWEERTDPEADRTRAGQERSDGAGA